MTDRPGDSEPHTAAGARRGATGASATRRVPRKSARASDDARLDPVLMRAVSYCLRERGAAAADSALLDLAERLYALRDDATPSRLTEAVGAERVATLRRAAEAMRADCAAPDDPREAARWKTCLDLAARLERLVGGSGSAAGAAAER
jgi:hypothetical protein